MNRKVFILVQLSFLDCYGDDKAFGAIFDCDYIVFTCGD